MTLIEPNACAELIAGDPKHQALRLRLVWQADRFGHVIEWVQADETRILLATAVDDATNAWPSNPPLQQASLEAISGSPVILGVGQAGTSHWSLSIETPDADEPTLRFDCACRSTSKPLSLGSQYVWSPDVRVQADAFAGLLLRAGETCLQIAPADEQTIATCDQAERLCDLHPDTLIDGTGQTVRWSYQITLM